eukprot:jgi/Bigna1/78050/fgenesh1_pg.52_\
MRVGSTALILLIASSALATRAGFFQQNGAMIDASADTNTQEDFHPEHMLKDGASKPRNLTVFILPHSHDDPGWVRTADQYFQFFVRPMYTTVVASLVKNPARKFQVVEVVYFRKWYEMATSEQQQNAHKLVKTGQLNFAVGGWVMPDEATVDYPDLINTMSLGHEWLYDTFSGVRVRHGFQVDPFGASSAFATFSAKLGFETHLVARLNYYDKGWMQDNKELEFVWRPSPSLYASPDRTEIFTHIMDQYQYSAPGIPTEVQLAELCAPPHNRTDCPGGGFYWDGDDGNPNAYWAEKWEEQGYAVYPTVNASNVEFYSDFLVNNSISRSSWFATDNLLWPFGTDFQHFNSTSMFSSMDKIIEHVNARNGAGQRYEGVTLQYSSLGDYFEAVRRAKPEGWSVRHGGDFLPYSTLNCNGISSDPLPSPCSGNAGPQFNVSWPQTWSGFFSSHARLKIQARKASRELRSGSQLLSIAALAKLEADGEQLQKPIGAVMASSVHTLRSAVGLVPHHDALSGTMGSGCGNDPKLGYKNISTCAALPMGTLGDAGAVANDYADRMLSGAAMVAKQTEAAAAYILDPESKNKSKEEKLSLSVDPEHFFAALKEGRGASAAVHNPLAWKVVSWVRVDVPTSMKSARVQDSLGAEVPSDILPGGALECIGDERIKAMCRLAATEQGLARGETAKNSRGDDGDGANSLYFRAEMPALGVAIFNVLPSEQDTAAAAAAASVEQQPDAVIESQYFSLKFLGGVLRSMKDLSTGIEMQMEQTMAEYKSFASVKNVTSPSAGGANSWTLTYTGSRSGSYLLHPSTLSPGGVAGAFKTPKMEVVRGSHVTEVRQWFSETHSQVYRVYTSERDELAGGFVELQMGVGPLEGNRELVARFDTDGGIPTDSGAGSEFLTDSNGFQLQRRVFSPTRFFPDGTSQDVSPDDSYTLALNFYPVVRSAHIRGHDLQLSVLTQQTGGATSTSSGNLEIMVHRRSLQDDSKGACQVFNDTTGSYATIPLDDSEGNTCTQFGWAGTCRADNCPSFAVPMNISTRVEPLMWFVAGKRSTCQGRWRQLSQLLNNRPSLLFSGKAHFDVKASAPMRRAALPLDVHLLTLQPRTADGMSQLVLRLQNIQEIAPASSAANNASGSANGPISIDFNKAGLCALLGKRARVSERALNSLPLDKDGYARNMFSGDETKTLDLVGSRGGAAAEFKSDATGRIDAHRQAAEGTQQVTGSRRFDTEGRACGFKTEIWPQDIKTFLITLE